MASDRARKLQMMTSSPRVNDTAEQIGPDLTRTIPMAR